MRSIEDAQQLVLQTARRREMASVLLGQTLGLILAKDVSSDLDMPPYDKALVDGFAVRSADLPQGKGELAIIAEIFAGETAAQKSAEVGPGQAVRIMTGAPIPPGADAVVMVERTGEAGSGFRVQGSGQTEQHPLAGADPQSPNTHDSRLTTHHRRVTIDAPKLRPGQNIMRRGTELTRGQVVLRAGTRIRPPEIGLLAEVGRATVSVYPRPRVAIISTGNELVEAHETPGPGQIRNSNGPMLAALVARAGGTPEYLGIARDTNDDLRRLVRIGLDAEMVLLSGGVSAGGLDLVPDVLRELGVREVFHKVDLKPGKPAWFGVRERSAPRTAHSTLVFGLPGNPVSVMVCFELFVRPAVRRMTGHTDCLPRTVRAALVEARQYRTDRPTYWPAQLELGADGFCVRPVAWHGSADLRATTETNSFLFFPVGDHQLVAGDRVEVLMIDSEPS